MKIYLRNQMCCIYTEKFKVNFMYSNARARKCILQFCLRFTRSDLRAPKTDFEKSQALGKKYYGHPAFMLFPIESERFK